jgi:tetratricopeptide (TPR) repeat protein
VKRIALGLVLLAVGCAARVPVVTSPEYPDYPFPMVPAAWVGSDDARRHEEAWTFLQAGELAGAERRYRELLASSPGFYPAATGLGWLNLARGDARQAAEQFERAVTAAANYVPAWIGRGESMLLLDETSEALRSFEEALLVDASLTRVERVVGELRFKLVSEQLTHARDSAAAGRLDEARGLYERVIAASPDSAFLRVELGRVELGRGSPDRARELAQEAMALDPSDPAAFVLDGELHLAAGDLAAAAASFGHAYRLDPNEDTALRLARIRDRQEQAALPPAIAAIGSQPEVTRGELAALIGTRFGDLLRSAAPGRTVIITDTRDHWGQAWILDVTRAGVMQVDAGYRFEPARTVRRGELAGVVDALLDLFAAVAPGAAASWDGPRQDFSDMRSGHLSYSSAARAVAAGVLEVLDGGTFQPTRPVAGGEALRAVDRLAALARELR